MADMPADSTNLIVLRSDLEPLRDRIQIKDTVSKTSKYLSAQIHERTASIEAFKGQIKNLEAMIEQKTEELEVLHERVALLRQIKD